MLGDSSDPVRASYDTAAGEYARRIFDELKDKPLDRELLTRLAGRVGKTGTICDMASGPGQVAKFLAECGASACGVDFSPQMLAHARQLNPTIAFQEGDMLHLPFPDQTWPAIAAFYAIVNIPPNQLVTVFREFHRTLQPGGTLLLSFHIGSEIKHLDQWWDLPVNIDFYYFPVADVVRHLQTAGFAIEEVIERDPYPDVEYPSRRAYIFAIKRPDVRGAGVSPAI